MAVNLPVVVGFDGSPESYDVVAEPEGFIVDGIDGPLHAGELARARAWGAALV